MDSVTIGLLLSVVLSISLFVLFSYEARTGKRFLSRPRAYADVLVFKISRSLEDIMSFIGRDLIRQCGRYFYHVMLRTSLAFTKKCEDILRNAIRTNKTIARSQDEERAERSKLEEIAYHKATITLSEEEKRKHREEMLKGF